MMGEELARRYARALHASAEEAKCIEAVFNEIRAINQSLVQNYDHLQFLSSGMIDSDSKKVALKALVELGLSKTTESFLYLLAENSRFDLFNSIVGAFQKIVDESHGVTRGRVQSANELGPEERRSIESTVTRVTGKKVILSFEQNQSLLGGMLAQVGGLTFDDSLDSHLKRMSEMMKRRSH